MKLYLDDIKRWSLGAVAAAWIIWSGCSDDRLEGNGYETTPSDCLAFTTSLVSESISSATRSTVSNLEIVEEQWALPMVRKDSCSSRGSIANQLSGSAGAGVLGFQYDEESDKSAIAGGDNNVEFEFDGDQLISKNTTILWNTITKKHLNVYAYVPYVSQETDGMKLDFTTAPPWIDYTVPNSIADQKDLLAARWISTDHENPDKPNEYKYNTIPLTFNHILTAIRFRVGFKCAVKSIAIEGVYNSRRYNLLQGAWEDTDSPKQSIATYTINFKNGDNDFVEFEAHKLLTGDGNDDYMILMPQTLPEGAKIVFTYVKNGKDVVERTADIKGMIWAPGKLITYTLYEGTVPGSIYFDLALGDVTIQANADGVGTYSGKVYKYDAKSGKKDIVTVSGDYKKSENQYHFYVYQSTEANRENIWDEAGNVCTPPEYDPVKYSDDILWSDFITNNTNVESVIENWDINHNKHVEDVGRKPTKHRIEIWGNVTCDLTIDNIYSTYQDPSTGRRAGGISFEPQHPNKDSGRDATIKEAKVTVKIIGDNRVGTVHYYNFTGGGNSPNGNEIIFEGTGSLTIADVDGYQYYDSNVGVTGYYSNHWCAAIGGNDDNKHEESDGIVINSGIIFAGTTKAENCTAIGGGGNAFGRVEINGGTVTAVATSTGTAIGGGIGYGSPGGLARVTITGGNIYAYNHGNKWLSPSSAIGGAGSIHSTASGESVVDISGGYVYAESDLGPGIGGGSSYYLQGGSVKVIISGGEVIAKTKAHGSAGIGGGTGFSQGLQAAGGKKPTGKAEVYDGGYADITIKNNPMIRTGSIGGGGTGDSKGHIGNATIRVSGGDIQAQFLLAAGTASGKTPSFEMTDGRIRNSDTADPVYLHVMPNGGAVYMENGTVKISGGTIQNCKAERGGAIYIEGSFDATSNKYNASFTMSGNGVIKDNESYRTTGKSDKDFVGSGGAVYIIDGNVELTGGTISDNLAAGGNGGGIFIRRGSLKVSGDTRIENNASEIRETDKTGIYGGGNGGGIYVYSQIADVDVNLESGKIIGNTADRRGGGLCVIQDNSDGYNKKAMITIGSEGGGNETLEITGNHTLLQGGGIYAKGENAHITINSGTIQNNTVAQYVHNKNVTNEEGAVTLNGGDVTHIVVTFHANDGSENPKTDTQKIVTETNSKLKTPEFSRINYELVGWNTKPSGTGKSYAIGAIMNIHEDITLYAQWRVLK